ncbi:MAG: type II secretion system F family protein [Candidatus Omnitrophica bacterium]|nr:type II secretion system F family protein [Candidatus Omnitrophota bacterium]
MPKFFYIARNKLGNKLSGVEEASNQEEALAQLQAKDLIIINIFPEAREVSGLKEEVVKKLRYRRRRHHRIKSGDLVIFCRQLATLLGAGVTILKSLDIITQDLASVRLGEVIKTLQKDMEGGLSFHEAMNKHPRVFSELWTNLVESGEASGSLPVILSRLAEYLEKAAEFRRRIITTLIYPAILIVAGFIALGILTFYIVPTFLTIFKDFKMDLPLLTKMLFRFSTFLQHYYLRLFLGIAIVIYLLKKYIRTPSGRRKYEETLFKLPIFGEFFRAIVIERFTAEISTLIESGVPILYSLEIIEHSIGNLTVSDIIRRVKDKVREGKTLSQPMEDSGFFAPMVVQMVLIGEEIGELAEMFKKINFFYKEYIETFMQRFVSLFEPIAMLVLAVIIGTIVIALYLPIFQIATLPSM